MTDLTGWLAIFNLIILLGGGIVGYFTVRSAITKANQDTQDRVREALSAENELLAKKVERVERENRRLDKLMQLIVVTLRKTQNIELEIDDDLIILRAKGVTHTSRITGDLVP